MHESWLTLEQFEKNNRKSNTENRCMGCHSNKFLYVNSSQKSAKCKNVFREFLGTIHKY